MRFRVGICAIRRRRPRAELAILLLSGTTASTALACQPAWLPSIRFPGRVSLVVVVGRDTVPDLAIPVFHPDRATAFTTYDFASRRVPYGVVARVSAAARSGLRTGSEVVLVPWDYGPDCLPYRRVGSARWSTTGSAGALSGWLRPRAGWVAGTPTIDVEFADLEPRWHDNEARWPHDRSRLMSAFEFVAFSEVLPTWEEQQARSRQAQNTVERWVRANPGLARKEPAATMLGNLRRYWKDVAAQQGGR